MRYQRLNRQREASAAQMHRRRDETDAALRPLLGDGGLSALLCPAHFKQLWLHASTIGSIPGVDHTLVKKIDEYSGIWAGLAWTDELLRLTTGRLVDLLLMKLEGCLHSEPTLTIMLAHDSSLVPVLVALGIYTSEWPPLASALVFELAEIRGQQCVRVSMNDDVRIDWRPWGNFRAHVGKFGLSQDAHTACCNSSL